MDDIVIDKEFKELLFPLSEEERKILEENIIKDGCLTPLILWGNILVDGHNRYEICTKHNIPYKTTNKDFDNRDDVIEFILRTQLGRRNLTDFHRNRIALRYEEILKKKAKERQSEYYGNQFQEVDFGSFDPKSKEPFETNTELGKIAGTSRASVMRTKVILKHGTQEQIERAEKGGKENTISGIYNEIMNEINPKKENSVQTKVCACCKKEVPITDFYKYRKECKNCYNTNHNLQRSGHKSEIPEEIKNMSAEDIIGDLYDIDKEMEYTEEDLLQEIEEYVKHFISGVSRVIEYHNDLSALSKDKIIEKINLMGNKIENLLQKG